MQSGENRNNWTNMSDDQVFFISLKNPDAFGEIVTRYERPFINKAKSILGSEEDAYDAVQEAFVRIYSAGHRYRIQKKASFRAWAYKVLINQCFTMYAKKRREMILEVESEELAESVPDKEEMHSFERKLSKEYLMSLISKLPEMLARAVTLHFIEGVPQKEIAALEGVSNEVVRTRIHRAKKQLKDIAANI